jgi:hypothetical protein
MIFQVYIFDHANEHEARNALVSFVAEYLGRYDVHVTDGTYFKTDLRPYLGQIA